MPPLFRSPSKLVENTTESKIKSSYASLNNGSLVVGLPIVMQIPQGKSNIVVKSSLGVTHPAPRTHPPPPSSIDSCFLKSCHLCNMMLSLDKDVYMYRGDQGYCSIECRERQIVLDELRDLETSTKKMIPSYRHCNSSGPRETQPILEDLRRQHKRSPHQSNWAIVA